MIITSQTGARREKKMLPQIPQMLCNDTSHSLALLASEEVHVFLAVASTCHNARPAVRYHHVTSQNTHITLLRYFHPAMLFYYYYFFEGPVIAVTKPFLQPQTQQIAGINWFRSLIVTAARHCYRAPQVNYAVRCRAIISIDKPKTEGYHFLYHELFLRGHLLEAEFRQQHALIPTSTSDDAATWPSWHSMHV